MARICGSGSSSASITSDSGLPVSGCQANTSTKQKGTPVVIA
jgi:hypothetical protein